MKPRILIASQAYLQTIGGTAVYLRRFSEELARRGYKVTVLTTASPLNTCEVNGVNTKEIKTSFADAALNMLKISPLLLRSCNVMISIELGIILLTLSLSTLLGKILKRYELTVNLAWYLMLIKELFVLQREFDVIHSYNFLGSGFPSCAVGRMLRKPVIVDEVMNPLSFYEGLRSRTARLLVKYVTQHASLIYVGSRKLQVILNTFGICDRKITVKRMPIDTNIFKPPDNRDEQKKILHLDGKFVLLHVGRLLPFKNVESLINAMAVIKDRMLNSVLLIVGGPETRKEFLEQLAEELQVTDYVRLVGPVASDEIYKYYQVADVFVSLSMQPTFLKNYSHPDAVILEAMASGVPVISTPDLQIIGDEELPRVETFKIIKTGIIVNSEDLRNFVDAAAFLYAHPSLRKDMAENCRNSVKYGWNEHLDEIIAAYENQKVFA